MDGKELREAVNATLEAIQAALEARLARRGDMVSTDASLLSLVREARDPNAYKAYDRPPVPKQLPVEPEYPRLKVKYERNTGRALEYKVVYDINEELPIMSVPWYRRPMSELEEVRRQIECAD